MSADAGAQLAEAFGDGQGVSAFRLGEVQQAGKGQLLLIADGILLEKEDLWINPQLDYRWQEDHGEIYLLRPGDRVCLLTLDDQDYYLICKAVRA